MGLRINDTIPDLTVETDQGSFSLHEFVGDSWAILFSHPKDFTPFARPNSAPWRGFPMSGKSAARR